MDSRVTKRAKIHQFKRQDRISHLPDKVLHCIFSFLPTDDVVRTSVLSRKWKDLWVSLSILDFDGMHFCNKRYEGAQLPFVTFVNSVLFRRDPIDIQKFRISGGASDYSRSDVCNWLVYATRHNVVELELIVDDGRCRVPSCLLSCKSLQRLTLGEFSIPECDIPFSVCFPNLKFLSLTLSNDSDFEFATQLVSTCPALQELEIKFFDCTEPGSLLEVESSSLIKLLLELCSDDFSSCDEEYCSILISAPNLVHLEVSATIAARYSVVSPSSIQLVRLDIGPCCGLNPVSILWDSVPNEMTFDHSISAHDLLREISKVQQLSLSGHSVRALIAGYENELLTLSNLVRLDIGVPYSWCLNLVLHLLRNAPELKILVLRKDCIHEDDSLNENERIASDAWIDCPLSHLEVIEIEEFQGKEGELKLIKYLLKNGKMLKKFVVRSKISDTAKMLLYKQILSFPRTSTTCVLEQRSLQFGRGFAFS